MEDKMLSIMGAIVLGVIVASILITILDNSCPVCVSTQSTDSDLEYIYFDVQNTSNTDYINTQVKLTLNTKQLIDEGKMRTDCSMFIYDDDYEKKPFYIENCYDENTIVYIKDSFEANEEKTYSICLDCGDDYLNSDFYVEERYDVPNMDTSTAAQGIAFSETNIYTSNRYTLYKYDRNFNLLTYNNTPFSCAHGTPNHLGDIFYKDGYIYGAVQYYNGVEADDNYMQIVKYDADTLDCIEAYDVNVNISALGYHDGYWIVTSYRNDINYLTLYDDNFNYVGKKEFDIKLNYIQGLDVVGDYLYVSLMNSTSWDYGGVVVLDWNRETGKYIFWNDFDSVEEEGIAYDPVTNTINMINNPRYVYKIRAVSRPYDGKDVFIYYNNFEDAKNDLTNYDSFDGANLDALDTHLHGISRSKNGQSVRYYDDKVDRVSLTAYLDFYNVYNKFKYGTEDLGSNNIYNVAYVIYTMGNTTDYTDVRDYMTVSDSSGNAVGVAWYRYDTNVFEYWDGVWNTTDVNLNTYVWNKFEYNFYPDSTKIYINDNLIFDRNDYILGLNRMSWEGGYGVWNKTYWTEMYFYEINDITATQQ